MENSKSNTNTQQKTKTKSEGGKKGKKVGNTTKGKTKNKLEGKAGTSKMHDRKYPSLSDLEHADFDSDSVSGYEFDSEMEIDLHTLMKGIKRKKGRRGDKEGEDSSSDELLPSKLHKDEPIVETTENPTITGELVKTPLEKLVSFVLAMPMPREKRTTVERLAENVKEKIMSEEDVNREVCKDYKKENKQLRIKVDNLEAEIWRIKRNDKGNKLEEKLEAKFNEKFNELSAKLDSFMSENSSRVKETPVSKPKLYSDIIKVNKKTRKIAKKAEIKQARPVVAIYPVDGSKIQSSDQTKEVLAEYVKPTEHGIKIRNLRKIRNSGLLLETETAEDLEQVLRNEKVQKRLKIGSLPKRKPKMIIYGVPSELTEKELQRTIEKQNLDLSSEEKPEEEFKLLFKTGKKDKDVTNWVVEVTPKTRKILLARNRVFIGFNAHGIKDYIAASRCFKCQAFGHVAKYCKAKIDTCGHCGEDGHTYKDCTKKNEKGTCINCKRAGKSANHGLKDKNCPAYKHAIETSLSRIDFGGDENT